MMAFDWQGYLTLAEQLAADGDEAKLRTAVSRAYYALFNLARAYVQRHFPDVHLTKTGDDHQKVWLALMDRSRSRPEISLGNRGLGLCRKRRDADYAETFPNAKWCADDAISAAKSSLQLLKA